MLSRLKLATIYSEAYVPYLSSIMTAGIREIEKKEKSGRNKKDEVVDSVCSLINLLSKKVVLN